MLDKLINDEDTDILVVPQLMNQIELTELNGKKNEKLLIFHII